MGKLSERELKGYVKDRIREERLTDMCNNVSFDSRFPGLMAYYEGESTIVINLPKFYSTIAKDGVKGNVANLVVFQALEHEIEHMWHFKKVHLLNKDDEESFLLSRSINFSMSKLIYTIGENYNALYHEYDADIKSVDRLLTDDMFLYYATRCGNKDLIEFNRLMAGRILRRYRKDDIKSPIGFFLRKAYNEHGYIGDKDYERINDYLASMGESKDNLIRGGQIGDYRDLLENVSNGIEQTENVMKLVK